MLLSVLPREEHISFEYHLAGAVAGVLAALLFHARDPLPPRKRYSWEDEEDTIEAVPDEEFELPRPREVPVLWQRADAPDTARVIESSVRAGARSIRGVRPCTEPSSARCANRAKLSQMNHGLPA